MCCNIGIAVFFLEIYSAGVDRLENSNAAGVNGQFLFDNCFILLSFLLLFESNILFILAVWNIFLISVDVHLIEKKFKNFVYECKC